MRLGISLRAFTHGNLHDSVMQTCDAPWWPPLVSAPVNTILLQKLHDPLAMEHLFKLLISFPMPVVEMIVHGMGSGYAVNIISQRRANSQEVVIQAICSVFGSAMSVNYHPTELPPLHPSPTHHYLSTI
jgi:hypothetical protein